MMCLPGSHLEKDWRDCMNASMSFLNIISCHGSSYR